MSEKRTIGVKSIEIGDIAGDGGMGLTLAALGVTVEGSATLTKEEDAETEFYCEESDDPIETVLKKGKTTLAFAIADFTAATLVKVLGGEDNAGKWEAPDSAAEIEKSIKVTTKKNMVIEIVRAKIKSSLDINLGKNSLGQVKIVATILTPTKADTPAYSISHVAE